MMAVNTSLKAQEVTITLWPGCNWISYPNAEPMSIATALGDFTPMEGDVIKSQYGFTSYYNGRWRGGMTHFMPGWGYKYYSARTEVVEFVFAQSSSLSIVTTSEPTDITATSAVVGSTVTIDEGNHIYVRGVCWGTAPSPDIDGSHTTDGTSIGSFTTTLEGLSPNTTYYVRAYVVSDYGLAYGNQRSFTTEPLPSYTITVSSEPAEGGTIAGGGIYEQGQSCTLTATAIEGYTFANWTESGSVVSTDASYTFTVGTDRSLVANFTAIGNDHAYVDLGLPSGLLWATCNVGADNPEDYGDYFAWGETQQKDTYSWSTYQYCMGTDHTLTKYCSNSSYGYNGFTDTLTTLLLEDDAATAIWGSNWRMPSKEEWQELYNNTTVIWTTQNGVNGRLFTASNGNSLFLPASGYLTGSSGLRLYAGSRGHYWSSSLGTGSGYPNYVWEFYFDSDSFRIDHYGLRCCGGSVRPVRSSGQNHAPTGAINGKFTINADGDQVYFSQGNLQYQASTNTWRFAENQWDYVGTQTPQYGEPGGTVAGSDNSNISSSYNGWIDLFGWGTSGYNHGAVGYQPWSTRDGCDYCYYAYGIDTCNLYDQTGQADWGYNPISNGGNITNKWRTLTQSEWSYVFKTRTTVSGIRYAKANVNGVNGVILLPDDWSENTYSLNNTNSSDARFSSNTITNTQWFVFENAGAVFLPTAGSRQGTSVTYVDITGDYWSASYLNEGLYHCAYCVHFDDSHFWTSGSHVCYFGHSVRLVCISE